MADPTQLDRIESALAALATHMTRLDLQQQQQTGQLISISAGVQIMTATADQTASAVTAENAKIEQFLALVTPQVAALTAALTDARAQIAALQAGDAAAATTLGTTVDAAVAETARVQAAIDALTPPAPGG